MTSNVEFRKLWHVFFPWNDEKEERWLREMARSGWRLVKAGNFRYAFEAVPPEEMVYRVDFRVLKTWEREEYETLFRDAGWEKVNSVGNWHFFRTPTEPEATPDIFSDKESRIAMYRRLLAVLVVLVPLLNIGMMRQLWSDHGHQVWPSQPFFTFWVIVVGFWAYALIRILMRISQLRKK